MRGARPSPTPGRVRTDPAAGPAIDGRYREGAERGLAGNAPEHDQVAVVAVILAAELVVEAEDVLQRDVRLAEHEAGLDGREALMHAAPGGVRAVAVVVLGQAQRRHRLIRQVEHAVQVEPGQSPAVPVVRRPGEVREVVRANRLDLDRACRLEVLQDFRLSRSDGAVYEY